MYGKHRKIALYTGSETECHKWIMSLASEHIRTRDGSLRVGVINEPDGKVYDVGQSIMYQIVDAADGEIGIYNEPDGNQPLITG